MKYQGWWLNFIGATVAAWQESGENPALFCYLMGWDAFSTIRAGALVPVAVQIRNNSECLTPSSTSFTRYSTQKGYRS
jgi:hypothetical protein